MECNCHRWDGVWNISTHSNCKLPQSRHQTAVPPWGRLSAGMAKTLARFLNEEKVTRCSNPFLSVCCIIYFRRIYSLGNWFGLTEENHTSKSKPNKDHQIHLKDIPSPQLYNLETTGKNRADFHMDHMVKPRWLGLWRGHSPSFPVSPSSSTIYHPLSSCIGHPRGKGLVPPPTHSCRFTAALSPWILQCRPYLPQCACQGHLGNHALFPLGFVLSTHSNINTT